MRSIPNNSQNLNRTRPHPPITDRSSPSQISTIDRTSSSTHDRYPQSILAGGVGRVRSQFLEFGDDYLHKPAPTDPMI
jgi:hypothetical protein